MCDKLFAVTVYHIYIWLLGHYYCFLMGERKNNKVVPTDLAERHQEVKQHRYLDTQQCHRGSQLLCVFVCLFTHLLCPHGNNSSSSISHTHIEMEEQGQDGYTEMQSQIVFMMQLIIKHL